MNAEGTTPEPERARARDRGWGPFTGRQLTTIVCVGIVTMLFPVGAWALTTTNTYITDAHTHNSATVNAAGQLATSAAVSGAVTATESSPKEFWNGRLKGTPPMPVATPFAAPPAGKALIVTSISINYTKTASATGTLEFLLSTVNATCSSTGNTILEDSPTAHGVKNLTFQPGLVVPAGRALCALDSDTNNITADVFVDGYLVPAASAPAGAPAG